MSESTNINPEVIVTVAGTQSLIKQDYPFVNFINNKKNPPVAFNETIKENFQKDKDVIYGFLSPYNNFAAKDSITHIVDMFKEYPEINGIYSDQYYIDEHGKNILLYPSYHYDKIRKYRINCPLFFKLNKFELFNEQLRYLYFMDMLYRLCRSTVMFHIPELLFTTQHTTKENIAHDLSFFQQYIDN